MNFWDSLPLEKVKFLNKKLRLFRISNLKNSLFRRVKQLLKSNQTCHGVSPGYLKSRKKRISRIACLWKKLGF